MDSEAIRVFLRELNVELNLFSFDYIVTIPKPFSYLANVTVIRPSDEDFRKCRNVHSHVRGPLFKELLKPTGIATGLTDGDAAASKSATAKRKHSSSSYVESSAKRMKDDQHDSIVTAGNSTILSAEDQIDLEDEKVIDAIEHLSAFLEKKNLEELRYVIKNSRDEAELETGFGIHLLSKLAGKAFTSKMKSLRSCPCGCSEKIQAQENMWIGSKDTWYGELDIITGNPATESSVLVSFDEENIDCDIEVHGKMEQLTRQSDNENTPEDDEFSGDEGKPKEEGESPGDRTNVEVKFRHTDITPKLNQLVTQAVVFAFTEYNRHKTKQKCIPSVLINKAGFQFVIYNPVDDILLVSNYVLFVEESCFDPATAFPFILLWIILNHRIFFSKNPDFKKTLNFVKSGFHAKMTGIEHFQNLAEYSKYIARKQSAPLSFPNDTPTLVTNAGRHWFLQNKTKD